MHIDKETYLIGAILAGVSCFALGSALGASVLGPSNGKNWIDFLAMLGGWVSGIGALAAVIVALNIADRQAKHEQVQDAVRCIHHALAIINDLKGRLHSMKLMLTEGGRPFLALTRNAAAIEKRYESLYDRDIYRHAPGEVVNLITSLSGRFFGLFVLVEGMAAIATQKSLHTIPAAAESKSSLEETFLSLDAELDLLFSKFTNMRKKLEN